MIMERVEVRRLSYIDTLRGSGVYVEFVVTVIVLTVAFIDCVEDISDLSYLSHVAAILSRKVRALAVEMVYVTAAYLFAKWTSFRDSWTPGVLNDDGCRLENAGLCPHRLGLDSVILDSVRITCAVSADATSSRSDSSACDISGLIEANVLDLSSVPYRCLISLGSAGLFSRNQVSTTIFSNDGDISSSTYMTSP